MRRITVICDRCDREETKDRPRSGNARITHLFPGWRFHREEVCPDCTRQPGVGPGRPTLSPDEWADGIEERYPGLIALLSERSNAALAKRYGVSHQWIGLVRKRAGIERRTPEWHDLLGDVHDAAISRRYKVSRQHVRRERVKRGLKCPKKPLAEPAWLDGIRDRLGVERDADLAKEAGVSLMTLNRWRRRLGIPSPTQQRPPTDP